MKTRLAPPLPARRSRYRSIPVLTVSALVFLYAFSFPAPFADNPAQGLCMAGTETEASKEKPSGKTAEKKAADPSVTVYVTSWCPACTMTINYLKKKKIPFTVKDIEKNRDYMKEMVEKAGGYRGVPVLDINGKTYLGFHPSIIDNLEKK